VDPSHTEGRAVSGDPVVASTSTSVITDETRPEWQELGVRAVNANAERGRWAAAELDDVLAMLGLDGTVLTGAGTCRCGKALNDHELGSGSGTCRQCQRLRARRERAKPPDDA
jgi:hypothetical protein